MRVKITGLVEDGDARLLPGQIMDVDDRTGQRWVKAEVAVELSPVIDAAPAPAPRKRRKDALAAEEY